MRVLHRNIGRYSGPVIYGTKTAERPKGDDAEFHIERAYWLTCQAETNNRLGSVMMADGTAFTIGRDQHIAVYPRELANEDYNAEDDQGGAWKLLADMERAHCPVGPLWDALEEQGWYVAPDGTLRWLNDNQVTVKRRTLTVQAGDLVHGAAIREAFTPGGGTVSKNGKDWVTAKRWATLLHDLTSHESTWPVQQDFGIEHLGHRVQVRKLRIHPKRRWQTVQRAVYGPLNFETARSEDLELDELDLALCVLHSYTVNAPAIAFRLLARAISSSSWDPFQDNKLHLADRFARILLQAIKTKKYGRWDHRWVRTRKAAIDCGWWPPHHFRGEGVMTP